MTPTSGPDELNAPGCSPAAGPDESLASGATADGDAQRPRPTRELLRRRGIRLRNRSVRQHAARGTVVNSVFNILVALISMVRGLVIARFLTRSDYGIWGILVASMGTLFMLKQVGIGDKYVQQQGEDDELAFQHAFTIECIVDGAFLVFLLVAVPIVAALYGRSELLLPGLSLALLLPTAALQTPMWVFYRQMRFTKQRLIQAIDPLVGSVTALALAIAGAGYWALLGGVFAGAWTTTLVTLLVSPYKLRFRLVPGQLRSYMRFSWPLFVTSIASLVLVQASLFFGTEVTGLAGAGAITLAVNVVQFSENVDQVVSGTMYPVICAVQDRLDLLHESFVKSNLVALLWAIPFGAGIALFGSDLVHWGLGDRWKPAIPLLTAFGCTAAIAQLGFNWDDYYRARGDTRPVAWVMGWTTLSFLVVGIPLIYAWGLKGFAVGIVIQVLVNVACRMFYIRRMFKSFDIVRHTARAFLPTVPAIAAVLGMRVVDSASRTLGEAAAEVAVFCTLSAAMIWLRERKLVREMLSYLRRS